MPVTIRPFQPDDLPTLKEITVAAFQHVSIESNIEAKFGPIAGHDWRWRKARHLDHDLTLPLAAILVAELDGEVVGYISTWISEPEGVGYIPNLALRESQRRQGLGRQLIEQALAHFRRAGIRYARIETLDQNPIGQHLYPALGFQEVARQVHYFACLDDDAAADAQGKTP